MDSIFGIDGGTITAILNSPEVQKYGRGALEWIGIFSIAPKLLTALLPQATRFADTVSGVLLRLPVVGPVILQFAPDFIKAFDELVAAADKLVDTFRDRLDDNIRKAAKEAAAATPSSMPAPAGVTPKKEEPAVPTAPKKEEVAGVVPPADGKP